MPRPGPRPYECVRKAWHSDRHQPIRGSLIQEIFRVVNEVHSAATKKNKEWQEKLPIVVLKAEEIMYSKANSEAEYMDLKTLWDRANDAINTIIRRDERTESGKLLHACIEAALNLGCTPRRASRSHRNSNARCYLSPGTQEPPSVSPGTVESASQGTYSTSSQYMSRCSNFVSPASLISNCPSPVARNKDFAANMSPFSSEDTLPSCYNPGSSKENYPATNSYAVYPVHYVNRHQFKEPQHLPKLSFNTLGPAKVGLESCFPCNVDASYKLTEANSRATPENPSKIGCDLSLQLGPVSETFPNVRNSQLKDVEDICSGNSPNGSKVRDQSPQVDKKFLFPGDNQYGALLDSYSSKWSFEGRHRNVEATMKKRKAVFYHPDDDQQFCWHPKLPCSHLTGSLRNAGS